MSKRERIVVIGNGMVGYKLCEIIADSRGFEHCDITAFGEEPRPAYDRVNLTSYFAGKSADDLLMAPRSWYASHGVRLETGDPVVEVDRSAKLVRSAKGLEVGYDRLVFATGSYPFVPPFEGHDLPGVFVYRTIEDLDAIRARAGGVQNAAVIGGGLLGLEAAKALYDLGLESHVIEAAPGLMMRQVDAAGADFLADKIRDLGVHVHTGRITARVALVDRGLRLHFRDDEPLDVGILVVSAGIRPRDDLARACGLTIAERGGIVVDDQLRTSDPDIFAIGECASYRGFVYGLVAPGYQMANVVADVLLGGEKSFTGADLSTKLKLMGVDVASIGDSTALPSPDRTFIAVRDEIGGVYKKLVVNKDTGALSGAILVGDAEDYAKLLHSFRSGERLPDPPIAMIVQGDSRSKALSVIDLADEALLCTCNNVTKGDICGAVAGGADSVPAIKTCTKAGTGCGGCLPQVKQLLDAELARAGVAVSKKICEHFAMSREDLFAAVKIGRLRSYDEVFERHGTGVLGCEICKPTVASILASLYNEPAIEHQILQDTNDRFLANIQRGGTYSVVPRIPGGEISPDKLITLGEVAKKYDLYLKITGGQRIDMFGARVDQMPEIWKVLVEAGFESGHAYAKGMRTVKSCVGSTWCRYGLLDSVAFAIRVEHRYKGLRSPHKLKSAVSGCIRECAEARSKDFGIIATSEGWNLYLCGNGGANPRHADLFASGLDDETCLRYIDRFLMYYIHTAEPLMRTARWLEELAGGIDRLREVVIDDALGICSQLDADMDALVDVYQCEWAAVVKDPDKQQRFRAFVNDVGGDSSIEFVAERDQKKPASGGGYVSLMRATIASNGTEVFR